jgi:hypothetical protein
MFLAFMVFIVVLLGLAAVNLVAPLVLWKSYGPRSLLAPLAFPATAALCGSAVIFGPRLVLASTPSSPDTFLRSGTQTELERVSDELLSGRSRVSIEHRLHDLGFSRVEVDTVGKAVLLGHYRRRTWYEYIYVSNGLPPTQWSRPELPPFRKLRQRWYFRRW